MSLFESSTNPFEEPAEVNVAPTTTETHEDNTNTTTTTITDNTNSNNTIEAVTNHTSDGAEEITNSLDVKDVLNDTIDDLTTTMISPPPAVSTATPLPSSPEPTAASSSSSSSSAPIIHDVVSPIRHTLLPSSSPSASSSYNTESDGMLTPRSLARKIDAHNARNGGSSDDHHDEADVSDHPSLPSPESLENPNAPRYVAVVAGFKLRGDGLDMHTRYEIACRWKPSIVAASAAAIAAAKAKSQAGGGDGTSTSSLASHLTRIPSTSKVGRRFNDFVTLQALLTQLYPAYLIPCLPPKGLLQRFDEEFILQRQRGLQRFLLDLSRSKTLAEERLVTDFLVASTREWETISTSAQQLHNMGSTGRWLLQGTMNLTSKLLTSMGKNTHPESHTHDEHYHTSIESGIYHQQLNLQYDHLNTMFDTIVAQEKELSEAWLNWYVGFEEQDDSLQSSRISQTHDLLGLDFAQLLPLTQRIGLLSLNKAYTEVSSISELFQHTSGMVGQLQELFKRRQTVSLAVHTAEQQLKTNMQQLETMKRRVAMGEKTHEDEQRLASTLTQSQAILNDRRVALTSFHAIAEEQIRTYTKQRRTEMRECVAEFVHIQLQHEAAIQNYWTRLLQQLESAKK